MSQTSRVTREALDEQVAGAPEVAEVVRQLEEQYDAFVRGRGQSLLADEIQEHELRTVTGGEQHGLRASGRFLQAVAVRLQAGTQETPHLRLVTRIAISESKSFAMAAWGPNGSPLSLRHAARKVSSLAASKPIAMSASIHWTI